MSESTVTTVTPYAASKMLAETHKVAVRPQMVYNYVNKGYIPSTEGRIEISDLMEWADKYVAKKIAKAQKVMDELAGK